MTIYLVILLFIPLLLLVAASPIQAVLAKMMFMMVYAIYVFYHIDAGPDHTLYQWVYDTDPAGVNYEPIYRLLTSIAKGLNFNYVEFLVLVRLVSFSVLAIAVFKLDKYKLIFFFCLYIPISFVTFELNLLRQGLAIHFGLLAAAFLCDNKKGKSYFSVGLAILSHFSSLLLGLLYIKKINRQMVFVGFLFLAILSYNLPYLLGKINDYREIGAFNFRFDISLVQTVILIVLPFIIFKMEGPALPKLFYVALCLLAVLPVMVRLYPVGLLILLPLIQAPKTRTPRMLLACFILLSVGLTMGKTMLLLQADNQSIEQGVYSRGYQG
ncbi:EpsG-like putative glucosyltransferase [Enterobacter sp. BIGb0383]|uniref:EpsG family protein n=1 Tax=unclassified Enterobacter TaxID=2608935 RepID=UPI000F47B134|nr:MULTISPECIES: EpsG family protein [unclassified Enterobacter]ROP62682.1 EpsG-like putative glucosyltransferase [Enterobacter sp. BIGb0383]ROS12843.1 EpsG-like putative glucosyltransferase [Enterobacter sp. BIGb0359]